jgi:sulfate transport system ATP-binding protein
MSIQVEHICKQYGSFTALDDVSLTIASGELVALLGPSGSGKTTLLRIIAGLEAPDGGSILLHGEESTAHSASKRGIGFVFQHYALFRHMTIFENVAFGLRVQSRKIRPSRRVIRERVTELLRLVQLDSFARMFPDQLSGGQRQRVALARALAVKPKVLLLDEPFSALDAKVRKELRDWLRRIHDELHVTTVLVTHDQEEALEVADRVAILNHGKLEQIGTPQAIYDHPASPFVYNFSGQCESLSWAIAGRSFGGWKRKHARGIDSNRHWICAPARTGAFAHPAGWLEVGRRQRGAHPCGRSAGASGTFNRWKRQTVHGRGGSQALRRAGFGSRREGLCLAAIHPAL